MDGTAGMFGGGNSGGGGGSGPLGYSNEELDSPDFDVDAAYALSCPNGTEAAEIEFDYGVEGVTRSTTREGMEALGLGAEQIDEMVRT